MSSSSTNGGSTSAPDVTAGAERSGGTVEVTMPQMGVSVAEGTIVEWCRQPGDAIEADETICEVSTDKIDVEIPSPAAGTVGRLIAEVGETVAVGEVIAEIETGVKRREGADPEPEAPNGEPASGQLASPNDETDRSAVYSPVVQRMAAEKGIDLTQIRGTGVGGRIRKRDLIDHLAREHDQARGGEREAGAAEAHERPMHTESPYRHEEPPAEPEAGRAESALGAEDDGGATPTGDGVDQLVGPVRREPMSAVRAQTARHMLASRQTAAHCTTVAEVDFGRVAALRSELSPAMAERGVKLTSLAFVAQAAVAALDEHSLLNASIEGSEIVFHGDVNLGIAVATDQGLLVPVIRTAQRHSLEGMAAAIADVADRARSGALEPDDVYGGTFTITNPGRLGSILATPIINQPQVAILDLEAIVKRAVVAESESGDSIAIRPMANLCLSWDHRALDGVDAARFLATVRERLEGGEEWR